RTMPSFAQARALNRSAISPKFQYLGVVNYNYHIFLTIPDIHTPQTLSLFTLAAIANHLRCIFKG
ncbi:MAG: hypothetical protein RR485_00535, partial [Mucinivorans sp.]